jgi:hypothetical protein
MIKMPEKNIAGFVYAQIAALLVFSWIFFAVFNKFHLIYQEQTQLFLFDRSYFLGFLSKPGGLIFYCGAFCTQFFAVSWLAALLVTGSALAIFALVNLIARRIGLRSVVWASAPAALVVALQCSVAYPLGNALGFLIALAFIAAYIRIKPTRIRVGFGIAGLVLLYVACGGYSLVFASACFMYELFLQRWKFRFVAAGSYAVLAACVPYFAGQNFYAAGYAGAWTNPIPSALPVPLGFELFCALAYVPVLLAVAAIIGSKTTGQQRSGIGKNPRTAIVKAILTTAIVVGVPATAYDYKSECILGMDHYAQAEKWDRVLTLAKTYPGANRLVTYFANLALSKTGRLGDEMFAYPQNKSAGLFLPCDAVPQNLFFGGDLPYHLNFASAAYRFAFESMVVNGPTPRSLKRLAITCLTNGDYPQAQKYLAVLGKTLFYRTWAHRYGGFLDSKQGAFPDKELTEKRRFAVVSDFWLEDNLSLKNLDNLLQDHPDNKAALDYYLAYLLLDKKIDSFSTKLSFYTEPKTAMLPIHYQEAVLMYRYAYGGAGAEGFAIADEVNGRFKDFVRALSLHKHDNDKGASSMAAEFGSTYWYYLYFGSRIL